MTRTCFIISSIGEKDTETRKYADDKFDLVFEPVLKETGYEEVTRADKIGTPGSISYDIVNHIINSKLVIADVSDLNPNVFYELAIRNAVQKPVIVIKADGQKMPFDIYDKRAISIDMKSARQWIDAKEELRKQVENIEKNPNSASKSILTDFSEIRIRPKDEIDMNVNLMLKDLRSETRKILEEVKAFRTPAPQWKQSEEIFKREHLDLYIKRKIIDIISDGYREGIVFPDKESLLNKASKTIASPISVISLYYDTLVKQRRILESDSGIFINHE